MKNEQFYQKIKSLYPSDLAYIEKNYESGYWRPNTYNFQVYAFE